MRVISSTVCIYFALNWRETLLLTNCAPAKCSQLVTGLEEPRPDRQTDFDPCYIQPALHFYASFLSVTLSVECKSDAAFSVKCITGHLKYTGFMFVISYVSREEEQSACLHRCRKYWFVTKKNGQKYIWVCSSHCAKLNFSLLDSHPDSAHACSSCLFEMDWKYPFILKIFKNKSPQADLPVQETGCHVFSEGGGRKNMCATSISKKKLNFPGMHPAPRTPPPLITTACCSMAAFQMCCSGTYRKEVGRWFSGGGGWEGPL